MNTAAIHIVWFGLQYHLLGEFYFRFRSIEYQNIPAQCLHNKHYDVVINNSSIKYHYLTTNFIVIPYAFFFFHLNTYIIVLNSM